MLPGNVEADSLTNKSHIFVHGEDELPGEVIQQRILQTVEKGIEPLIINVFRFRKAIVNSSSAKEESMRTAESWLTIRCTQFKKTLRASYMLEFTVELH